MLVFFQDVLRDPPVVRAVDEVNVRIAVEFLSPSNSRSILNARPVFWPTVRSPCSSTKSVYCFFAATPEVPGHQAPVTRTRCPRYLLYGVLMMRLKGKAIVVLMMESLERECERVRVL